MIYTSTTHHLAQIPKYIIYPSPLRTLSLPPPFFITIPGCQLAQLAFVDRSRNCRRYSRRKHERRESNGSYSNPTPEIHLLHNHICHRNTKSCCSLRVNPRLTVVYNFNLSAFTNLTFYRLNQIPAVLCLSICGGIPTILLIRKLPNKRLVLLCLGLLSVGIWYGAYVINAMRWEKSGYYCLSQVAVNS